jgi:DNA gyrase subunit A
MLEKILKLSEEKKAALGGIYDIRDESDRTGLRAVIELRKDVDPQRILNCLYKYSDMQVTFGVNMVAIAEGKPVQMGLKVIIGHFIRHQKNVVTRRTQYDLDQAKARAHILEGLMVAVDNLDEVIAIIRSSKTQKDASNRLMERFGLTEIQAQAILDMRLRRLTNLEIIALRKEYEEVLRLISKLEGILASEKKLFGVIKTELTEMAADYTEPRRTQLVKEEEDTSAQEEEEAVPEEAVVMYTFGGQLKRMYPKFFEKLPPPDPQSGLTEVPRFLFNTLTDHTLLFITDRGNCYPLSVGSLPETNRPKDRGVLLTGVLNGLEDGEALCQLMCVKNADLKNSPDYLFITAQGMVKRTLASEYDVRRQKFATINLKDGDRLLQVFPATGEQDLLLISRGGQCIRFALDSVPQMGRATGGVKGIQLDDGDEILFGGQLGEKDQIVLISDRGSAKRLPAFDFETQGRNGKGVRCFAFNKNGSNGARLSGCARIGSEGASLVVTQAQSAPTALQSDEIALQAKADKGKPCVMALMEDVVTGLISGVKLP